MRRRYRTADYAALISGSKPELRKSVLVPTSWSASRAKTETEFEKMYNFIENQDIDYLQYWENHLPAIRVFYKKLFGLIF